MTDNIIIVRDISPTLEAVRDLDDNCITEELIILYVSVPRCYNHLKKWRKLNRLHIPFPDNAATLCVYLPSLQCQHR